MGALYSQQRNFSQLTAELLNENLNQFTANVTVSASIVQKYIARITLIADGNIIINGSTIEQQITSESHFLVKTQANFYNKLSLDQSLYLEQIIQSCIKGSTGKLLDGIVKAENIVEIANKIKNMSSQKTQMEAMISAKYEKHGELQLELKAKNIYITDSRFSQRIVDYVYMSVMTDIVGKAISEVMQSAKGIQDATVTTGSDLYAWLALVGIIAVICYFVTVMVKYKKDEKKTKERRQTEEQMQTEERRRREGKRQREEQRQREEKRQREEQRQREEKRQREEQRQKKNIDEENTIMIDNTPSIRRDNDRIIIV